MNPVNTQVDLPTSWIEAGYPLAPRDEQRLLTVDDALLTRHRLGPLRTATDRYRWMTGAVYDATGRLVPESQRVGGLHGNTLLAADTETTPVKSGLDRLEGTWLYGGNWMRHFGHFLCETVTSLWPERSQLPRLQGLVFHKYLGALETDHAWQAELLRLVGYGDLPIHVVQGSAVRVERLLVPSRTVVMHGWTLPGAVTSWTRMAEAAGPPATGRELVFLSRTRFNATRRQGPQQKRVRSTPEQDRKLDAVFAAAGFAVVAPEELPVTDQLRLVAGARVLAGQTGTALHLSAFSGAGTKVLELGDRRTGERPFPHQRVIDTARRHRVAFLPSTLVPDGVGDALRGLGVGAENTDRQTAPQQATTEPGRRRT